MTLLSMTIYAIVSSFTPGPNNIMSLYYSKQTDLRGTVRFCIGVALGFFYYYSYLISLVLLCITCSLKYNYI